MRSNILTNFRNFLLAIILFTGMVLTGCGGGGGNDPIGPGSGPTPVNPDPSAVETAKATIEPANSGSIALNDEASISVPAGTVAASSEVYFSRLDSAAPDDERVSHVYRIAGLEQRYGKIEISLPATQDISSDASNETYVVVTEGDVYRPSAITSDGSTAPRAQMILPAQIKNGKIVAELPESVDPSAAGSLLSPSLRMQGAGSTADIYAISDQRSSMIAQNRFKVIASRKIRNDYAAQIAQIEKTLSDTFSFLENQAGLSFAGGRTTVPVHVFKFSNSLLGGYRATDAWGYAEIPWAFSKQRSYISLNASKLTDTDSITQFAATIAHELFHLFQQLYVQRRDAHGWLQEASSVWIEYVMVNTTGFWPAVVSVSDLAGFPVNGLLRPEATYTAGADNHGYAAAAFLRYLSDKMGHAAIGRLWNSLKTSGNEPTAFSNSFNSNEWYKNWPEFVQKLYSGDYAPTGITSPWALIFQARSSELQWTIDNPYETTSKTFSTTLHALAARPVIINFSYASKGFDSNAKAQLIISNTNSTNVPELIVVQRNNATNDVVYQGKATPEAPLVINNLEQLQTPSFAIIAASTWSPAETTAKSVNIKVDISIDDPSDYYTMTDRGSYWQIDEYHPRGTNNNLPLVLNPQIPASKDGKPITRIGNRAFQQMGLTAVTIPDSITHIGSFAFFDNSISSLNIGSGLEYIDESAFNSNQIQSVTLPETLTWIGENAFNGNNISSITLGSNIDIRRRAFWGNPLETGSGAQIKIGSSVTIHSDGLLDSSKRFESAYSSGGAGTYAYNGSSWLKQ